MIGQRLLKVLSVQGSPFERFWGGGEAMAVDWCWRQCEGVGVSPPAARGIDRLALDVPPAGLG